MSSPAKRKRNLTAFKERIQRFVSPQKNVNMPLSNGETKRKDKYSRPKFTKRRKQFQLSSLHALIPDDMVEEDMVDVVKSVEGSTEIPIKMAALAGSGEGSKDSRINMQVDAVAVSEDGSKNSPIRIDGPENSVWWTAEPKMTYGKSPVTPRVRSVDLSRKGAPAHSRSKSDRGTQKQGGTARFYPLPPDSGIEDVLSSVSTYAKLSLSTSAPASTSTTFYKTPSNSHRLPSLPWTSSSPSLDLAPVCAPGRKSLIVVSDSSDDDDHDLPGENITRPALNTARAPLHITRSSPPLLPPRKQANEVIQLDTSESESENDSDSDSDSIATQIHRGQSPTSDTSSRTLGAEDEAVGRDGTESILIEDDDSSSDSGQSDSDSAVPLTAAEVAKELGYITDSENGDDDDEKSKENNEEGGVTLVNSIEGAATLVNSKTDFNDASLDGEVELIDETPAALNEDVKEAATTPVDSNADFKAAFPYNEADLIDETPAALNEDVEEEPTVESIVVPIVNNSKISHQVDLKIPMDQSFHGFRYMVSRAMGWDGVGTATMRIWAVRPVRYHRNDEVEVTGANMAAVLNWMSVILANNETTYFVISDQATYTPDHWSEEDKKINDEYRQEEWDRFKVPRSFEGFDGNRPLGWKGCRSFMMPILED